MPKKTREVKEKKKPVVVEEENVVKTAEISVTEKPNIIYENGVTPDMQLGEEKKFTVDQRVITKTKPNVCIVGCADSKKLVPWDRQDMEFWGVNNLYGVELVGAHYDRWFEIHNIELRADGKYYRRESLEFRGQPVHAYLQGIAKLDCPIIYMQKKWDVIPNSLEYPIDVITHLFGRYFTNTVSYEIALALLMGYGEIHIYGVDMSVGTEYNHQRPSCEYFIGWGMGRGIKIIIPDEADLLKTRFLYGFEEPKKKAWDKKVDMVKHTMQKKQMANLEMLKQNDAANNQYIGALHAIDELSKIWD